MSSITIRRSSRQSTSRRSMSWSRAGRAASIAAALIAGLAPATSQAQSMQSISDKLAQLQTSLNAFAASTATRLNTIVAKLDTIIASVAEPATPRALATAAVSKPDALHGAVCLVTNVGTTPATVVIRMIGGDGSVVASREATFLPNLTEGLNSGALDPRGLWCKFEPATAGTQLRAAVTIYRLSDLITIVHSEAR